MESQGSLGGPCAPTAMSGWAEVRSVPGISVWAKGVLKQIGAGAGPVRDAVCACNWSANPRVAVPPSPRRGDGQLDRRQ